MNLSIEGFAAFVREQPPEKEINHSTWCHCAVGEYVQQVLGYDNGDCLRLSNDWRIAGDFARDIAVNATKGGLNSGTYGQLQTALEEAGL